MASEATIRDGFQILKKSSDGTKTLIDYRTNPTTYKQDVSGAKGPVPGAVSVSVTGVNIDFSELDTPGLCRIYNQDDTNFITWGIWDPDNTKFFPVGVIFPGKWVTLYLSPDIQEEFGTGTGTSGAGANRLRLKADTASCNVLVEAFEA